jgi:16S rRNA (uracil1498-N3)-methyltransferase
LPPAPGPLIIARVLRRIYTPLLRTGEIELDAAEAHHARDVLRLTAGTEVEVFDDAGASAVGTLVACGSRGVVVRVDAVDDGGSATGAGALTIASAVPKGDRADWMVEKLSELGVDRFIPLATTRSVVLPEGKNKRERWVRIATEAAKQSRRRGVLRIEPLTPLADGVRDAVQNVADGARWYLSTADDAEPIAELLAAWRTVPAPRHPLALFIGPEGGWTTEETIAFELARFRGARLTDTILRVETAAVAAAAVVGVMRPDTAPARPEEESTSEL